MVGDPPVAGIAAATAPGRLNRTVLASRPVVGIGLISYPLYLWHWPLLVFFGTIKHCELTLLECELIVLASMLLAWATYRLVETPFRFGPATRANWRCWAPA
jgi:peptidoglycan/LPS O-acetylase OafA/YrhL